MTRAEELEAVARALCLLDRVDPDLCIDKPGRTPEPAWCSYRERARRELATHDAPAASAGTGKPAPD
jgi:tRNA-splicing ligase RtcB (3'-phosphate/5'-hydroxy nucleic acid ligase)